MSMEINALVAKIKETQQAIRGNECQNVLKMVEIGEMLVQLKQMSNGDWLKHIELLTYDKRVAGRLMQLGKSWWSKGGLKESNLLNELPLDLMKLEWLCRLSREQLIEGLRNWKVRKWSRSQVIDAVQGVLHVPSKPKAVRIVSLDRLTEEAERFVERALAAISASSDELADPTIRQRLFDEVSTTLAKVEEALGPENPDGSNLDSGNGSDLPSTEPVEQQPV